MLSRILSDRIGHERHDGTKAELFALQSYCSGIVYEPEHYIYSSAINYTGLQGLIDVLSME